jgi:N4-(beta-N-acetylglucosaminyl)-L-asparaginase
LTINFAGLNGDLTMSSRRKFLFNGSLAAAGAMGAPLWNRLPPLSGQSPEGPVVISTWDFGLAASAVAMDMLQKGASALDAVEAGVQVPEEDESITSVGRGGFPDADGDVTLDASIMDNRGRCGAVACLEKTLHPISVARAVMEKSPHVLLVGDKARKFATRMGFPKTNLLSADARKAWKEWRAGNPKWKAYSTDISNHDTIGMLALDQKGQLSGACTTSGWAFKIPGRVGDSPIIGAGLYVDNEVGAATSSGTGEEVIRICGSFLIVERMRQGASPQEACQEAIRRIRQYNPDRPDLFVGFIALNKAGEYGAWSTRDGFEYVVGNGQGHQLIKSGW